MAEGRRSHLFAIALPICALVGILGWWVPDELSATATAATGAVFRTFDWFFLLVTTGFLVFCVWIGASRFGRLRLGGPDEHPEFSRSAWLAMLFAAGMGSGLLFWGVAEPLTHYGALPVGASDTPEAARRAMVLTNFHWGLHAWAIYAVGGLVLAWFSFRRGLGILPGAPTSVFSGAWVRPVAHAANLLAVLAVAFGVAGSIAMGSLQLQTGLGTVLGAGAEAQWVRVVILVLLFVAYMTSAATSLDKGIRILSQLNVALAITVMVFVLFTGPTADLMRGFVSAVGDYLAALPVLSTETYAYTHVEDGRWFHGWTITYLVWWIAWAPFVGIFIARISRGRTVREFVAGVILAPTAFSILWFAVFGGAGIRAGDVVKTAVERDVTAALFTLLDGLPLSGVASAACLVLIFVFLVTSVDSATYVLGMLTSHGEEPPVRRKLAWGITLALLGGALLLVGRVDVVRAVTVLGALPFVLVMVLQVVALLKALPEK